MTFGERIRELREAAGLTQRDLRRETKLSSSYLHYIEKDRVVPGDKNVAKLARALGVPTVQLIEDRERSEFEKQGINPEVSLQLKKLGNLTEEEEAALLNEMASVRTARQQKRKRSVKTK